MNEVYFNVLGLCLVVVLSSIIIAFGLDYIVTKLKKGERL